MNHPAPLSGPTTRETSQKIVEAGEGAPLFDVEAALETLGCTDILREAAGAFVAMAPPLVAETALAQSRSDWPGLRRAAHSWKGATSYLGAPRIVQLASLLEHQAAAARIEGMETMVQQLLAGVEELTAELSAWLAANAATGMK